MNHGRESRMVTVRRKQAEADGNGSERKAEAHRDKLHPPGLPRVMGGGCVCFLPSG